MNESEDNNRQIIVAKNTFFHHHRVQQTQITSQYGSETEKFYSHLMTIISTIFNTAITALPLDSILLCCFSHEFFQFQLFVSRFSFQGSSTRLAVTQSGNRYGV